MTIDCFIAALAAELSHEFDAVIDTEEVLDVFPIKQLQWIQRKYKTPKLALPYVANLYEDMSY